MTGLEIRVNYSAIARNVEVLVERAAPAAVMAVVKADAYGHGLIEASKAARAGGAAWLGVAQPGEALALRAAGDVGRILTWLFGPEVDAAALVAADVDLAVSSLEVLDSIVTGAGAAGRVARIQVCVDTGLGREGVMPAQLDHLLDAATASPHVAVVGLWSHFAWADAPGHPTIDAQRDVFDAALASAARRGIELEVIHLANSAATLSRADLAYSLVRPGIAVYGLSPLSDATPAQLGLEPAMSVTATLALVKQVKAGQGVSYGHDYVADRDTVLGLVNAGYADGIFRSAGNRARVLVGGRLVTIAGRVCMDQFVVDLGPGAQDIAGDTVTLMGGDGPTAQDWADAVGTIHYEVVCRFGDHRPKVRA